VHYGQAGTRPDWGEDGSGRYELVRRNNGTGAAIKRYANQRKGSHLLGFEWEWLGNTADDLDRLMLGWAAWHAALVDLRDTINPKMRKYVATGPAAPECPWDIRRPTVHRSKQPLATGEKI
jgi:hypothetical protein